MDKLVVEAYSKVLPRALAPYDVMLTTSHTIFIDQDGNQNTKSADRASLAPFPHVQPQDDTADDKHKRSASESSVRNPGGSNGELEKDKSNEIQNRNVLFITSSSMSGMTAKGNMYCDGMDTLLMTIRWNRIKHPTILYQPLFEKGGKNGKSMPHNAPNVP